MPIKRDKIISQRGFNSIDDRARPVPACKAMAIDDDIPKIIIPTASSKATTGISISTRSPLALYCFITIRVAAGAVAQAIEPRTIEKPTDSFKIKISPRLTTKNAPKASKNVTKRIFPPIFCMFFIFISDPTEKAIKARATSEIISMAFTWSWDKSPKTEGPIKIPANR